MGCGCGGGARRPSRRPKVTQKLRARAPVQNTRNPNVPRISKQVKQANSQGKAPTTRPQSETSIMKHREKIRKLREAAILKKLERR